MCRAHPFIGDIMNPDNETTPFYNEAAKRYVLQRLLDSPACDGYIEYETNRLAVWAHHPATRAQYGTGWD